MSWRSFILLLHLLIGFLLINIQTINAQVTSDVRIIGNFNTGHEADRWYFGEYAGLDFRGTVPIADLSNDSLYIPTSPAIISDSAGNVLFYSNSKWVYNRLHQHMFPGDSLHGFPLTMSCLIAPKPDNHDLYYIFTIGRPIGDEYDSISPKYGLQYSVVNMQLDSGLGALVEKNIVLSEPKVSSKLTGVRHSNGTDYWIIIHMFDSDEFRAYLLTGDGIDSNFYVSSHIGSFHMPPFITNNSIGYMKCSPDGTKLALTIYGSGIIEIFDFNSATGQVTNAITSPPVFSEAYGLEFSPNTRFFYVSAISTSLPYPGHIPPSYLFQFDIEKGIGLFTEGNYDTVAQDTSGSYFGGMQIGRDGRIYVSRGPVGNTKVSVFQNPMRKGQSCNFSVDTVSLGGRHSFFGFPNFITSYFYMPHFDLDNSGGSHTMKFHLRNTNNIDSVLWDFGDPASSQNISREFQPTHNFSALGTFEVNVTEYFGGTSYGPYTQLVNVNLSGTTESGINIGEMSNIYPIPAKYHATLSLPALPDQESLNVRIYNLFGQMVSMKTYYSSNKTVELDVSGLSSGLYLLECEAQSGYSLKRKFVVAR